MRGCSGARVRGCADDVGGEVAAAAAVVVAVAAAEAAAAAAQRQAAAAAAAAGARRRRGRGLRGRRRSGRGRPDEPGQRATRPRERGDGVGAWGCGGESNTCGGEDTHACASPSSHGVPQPIRGWPVGERASGRGEVGGGGPRGGASRPVSVTGPCAPPLRLATSHTHRKANLGIPEVELYLRIIDKSA